jgi:hypothetical protein
MDSRGSRRTNRGPDSNPPEWARRDSTARPQGVGSMTPIWRAASLCADSVENRHASQKNAARSLRTAPQGIFEMFLSVRRRRPRTAAAWARSTTRPARRDGP